MPRSVLCTFQGLCLLALFWMYPAAQASSAERSRNREAVAHARAEVVAMGNQWSAEVLARTTHAYLPLHRNIDSTGIRQVTNVSYGPHSLQRLDLFVPAQGFDEPGPVLVFLHDSDAVANDKLVAGSDELFFSNVAKWVARVGGVGINANYRLAADALSAEGAADVRLLIDWIRSKVAAHGGDPQSVLVIGHGAGALRLAGYLFNSAAQPAGGSGITGAILASGRFDSPAFWRLVEGYRGVPVPLQLWKTEFDPTESGVVELHDKLCARQSACPRIAELSGHNHVSAIMSIDSDDTSATDAIIRFYHSAVHK